MHFMRRTVAFAPVGVYRCTLITDPLASIWLYVTGTEQTGTDSYDSLSRPIKSFIAEFVRKQTLGIASQAAGLLVCESLTEIGLDVDKEIALKDFGATSKVDLDQLI